jgi:thiamine biosynthesis lipoprotein
MISQRCAQLVADVTSCGVLISFGDDVATSGLAPLGGWRVELFDTAGAQRSGVVVAIDGGAISSMSSACAQRGAGRRTRVPPTTGPTSTPVWRSVTVAAADAPTASAACSRAMLWGEDAPALLAGFGLPALLIDTAGAAHTAGSWPDACGLMGTLSRSFV